MRPVWYAQQAWESVHVDDTGALLMQVFSGAGFCSCAAPVRARQTYASSTTSSILHRVVASGLGSSGRCAFAMDITPCVQVYRCDSWIFCLYEFRFFRKIRFTNVDLTEYGRSPKEMLFLRSGVGVLYVSFPIHVFYYLSLF